MKDTKRKLFNGSGFAQLSVSDIVAALVFVALFAWLCLCAPRGVNVADECFYYTIPHRLLLGDHLFTDEWHVSQLSSLLQFLPYRILTTVWGSNEGIILSMRYWAVITVMILYWVYYIKLREYGLWGVTVAFLACTYFPGGVLSMSYYTLSVHFLMLTCIFLIFHAGEYKPLFLVFTGLLFACSVLANPIFVILYFAYSGFCILHFLFRNRNMVFLRQYRAVLGRKTWFYFSVGCIIAFLALLIYLAVSSGLSAIIRTVPDLFTDTEYDLSFGGNHWEAIAWKQKAAIRFFGSFFCVCSFAVMLIAILRMVLLKEPKMRENAKWFLFIAACVFLIAEIVYGFVKLQELISGYAAVLFHYVFYFSFPLSVFGVACYLLCDDKPKKASAFLFFGLFASMLSAYSSEAFLSLAGNVSLVSVMISFRELYGELMNPVSVLKKGSVFKKERFGRISEKPAAKKTVQAVAVMVFCAALSWGSCNIFVQAFHPYVETLASSFSDSSLNETIERGPHKGIKTNKEMKKAYESVLFDLDTIAADPDLQVFYAAGICPAYYLYLNTSYGAYSTWYVEAASETRQLHYWELHPEKRPTHYYIPLYYDSLDFSRTWMTERKRLNEKLEFIQSVADCTVQKGEAGYIVKITDWK